MSLERRIVQFSIGKSFSEESNNKFEKISKMGAASATEMKIEEIDADVVSVDKYLKNGLEIGPYSKERWDSFCSVLNAVRSQIEKVRKRPNRTRRRVQVQVGQIYH